MNLGSSPPRHLPLIVGIVRAPPAALPESRASLGLLAGLPRPWARLPVPWRALRHAAAALGCAGLGGTRGVCFLPPGSQPGVHSRQDARGLWLPWADGETCEAGKCQSHRAEGCGDSSSFRGAHFRDRNPGASLRRWHLSWDLDNEKEPETRKRREEPSRYEGGGGGSRAKALRPGSDAAL